jgi:hypothetical protein
MTRSQHIIHNAGLPIPRRKYGNIPTEVDGQKFASRKEARRYSDLKLMERAGEIRFLRLQPRFPMDVNGVPVATYVADFAYVREADDVQVIEDVKSPATRKNPVYRIKIKLLKALHGIDVVEV